MDSLIGYGSDDDNETERYTSHQSSVGYGQGAGAATVGSARRREDDGTNYDDVNMDMSEDSQAESEPELPPAEAAPPKQSPRDDRHPDHRRDSRDRDGGRRRDDRRRDDRDRHRSDRDVRPDDRNARPEDRNARPDDPNARSDDRNTRPDDRNARPDDRNARSDDRNARPDNRNARPDRQPRDRDPKSADKYGKDVRPDDRHRSDRERMEHRGGRSEGGRRGQLGDRLDDRPSDVAKVPSLMDLKPFGGEVPPSYPGRGHSQDARDAVSPRFMDRERRDREKERDRDRHGRRSEEKRERARPGSRPRSRSRDRERGKPRASFPPPEHRAATSSERRVSPPSASLGSSDYRPTSYKVNKKLEVMEKMGLQIKTPDGSMATAQQLRQAASEAPAPSAAGHPSFFNAGAGGASKILDQVQKRKLLWSSKKSEAEEAAKWSGTRFAQDSDGKQVSKFMRLMGIKEPSAVKQEPPPSADPIKKQEELFQAMQAQYEVARAATHTMRGVGLGFQRGQF